MSKPSPRLRCPCTSGLLYADCCAPLHRGEREAPTAELLMRSRFAAFALGDADYVWRTLHPDSDDRARPKDVVLRELREASRRYKYMGLTILDRRETRVLFLARVFEKGKDKSFVELSEFAREGEAWRYLAGTAMRSAHIASLATLTIDTLPF